MSLALQILGPETLDSFLSEVFFLQHSVESGYLSDGFIVCRFRMFTISSGRCLDAACMLTSFGSKKLMVRHWCYWRRTIWWWRWMSNWVQHWRSALESVLWKNEPLPVHTCLSNMWYAAKLRLCFTLCQLYRNLAICAPSHRIWNIPFMLIACYQN